MGKILTHKGATKNELSHQKWSTLTCKYPKTCLLDGSAACEFASWQLWMEMLFVNLWAYKV